MTDAERNTVIEECAAFVVQKATILEGLVPPNRIAAIQREVVTDCFRNVALAMRAEMKR